MPGPKCGALARAATGALAPLRGDAAAAPMGMSLEAIAIFTGMPNTRPVDEVQAALAWLMFSKRTKAYCERPRPSLRYAKRWDPPLF